MSLPLLPLSLEWITAVYVLTLRRMHTLSLGTAVIDAARGHITACCSNVNIPTVHLNGDP